MLSLAGTLDVMRPLLPLALVSADAFEGACAAVERLEAAATNGIYFECRLHDRSPRVDLVVIVREEGGALLAAPTGKASSDPGCDNPSRSPLPAFCQRWTAPASSLRDLIDHIWLEYDIEPGQPPPEAAGPGPCVFLRLRRPLRAHSPRALCGRVLAALAALTQRPASPIVRECLSECFALMPPEAGVPYIGLMAGREVQTIRVCIAKFPAVDVAHYLAATAAIGGEEVIEITRMASLPAGPGGPLYVPMLHLDIDERRGFLPRVGMERQFARDSQFRGRTGAAECNLLDALAAQGLCTGGKRDALLEWPGRSVAMLPHEPWWNVLERRVNHVKFVHEIDSGIETKAYLFARHYRRGERR